MALFLKQVKLRDSARAGSTDMGEGFAAPTGDSQQRAVMQVEFHSQVAGKADLAAIAAQHHMPPEVLDPVFLRAAEQGYLTHDGWEFEHTEAGRREAAAITDAWIGWLSLQVEQDIGRRPDAELEAAVYSIAKRMLVEDNDLGTSPSSPSPSSPASGSGSGEGRSLTSV